MLVFLRMRCLSSYFVSERQRFLRELMYAERVMGIAPSPGLSAILVEKLTKGTVAAKYSLNVLIRAQL